MGQNLLSIAQGLALGGEEFLLLDSAGHLHPERDHTSWLFHGEMLQRYQGSLQNSADMETLRQALSELDEDQAPLAGWISYEGDFCFTQFSQLLKQPCEQKIPAEQSIPSASSPPQPHPALQADSSDEHYLAAIQQALDYIAAGDIYQVNLARRWSLPWPVSTRSWQLYLQWRAQTSAPQSAYGKLSSKTLLSASPETFLQLTPEGKMSTHPIKGTIRASTDPQEDALLRQFLQNSPKERAELLMITDLLRHDLGQVAQIGSVELKALHQLESYGHLHHLVSSIEAQLDPSFDVLDLLQATHPGGSITGAPKKRACAIIAELEANPRGLYCGQIGWLHKDSCRFSIAIRTAVIEDEQLSYHAGSGIVADSKPAEELAETQLKASAFARSLQSFSEQAKKVIKP